MAYVNVAEWSPDQVAEWLKGLDDVLQPYIHSFVTKEITGRRLLHLAHDDFSSLNVTCIGHQEIILQGVELLSNIHYQIHQENVQHLALRLSSKARSIYNELRHYRAGDGQHKNGVIGEEDKEKDDKEADSRIDGSKDAKKERVSTSILSGVADVLSSVKVLVSWLHRNPFHGIEQYDELKSSLLDLSIRLATIAQRESFAENPVSVITDCCFKLAEMADAIIQDSKDPLILQPAFLDVVTIKKRADDNWGLGIYSSYHGVHQISMLRSLSPAHTCGKLMDGDQVVQVNYQTVVGWTLHKVTQLMQENPIQVILTMKKCPRHVNTITEIYFKPFRLPSKKRTYSPWPNNSMSGQPYDLQSIPNLQFIKSFDGRAAAQRVVSTEPHPKGTNAPAPAASLNSSGSEVGPATASESESDEGPISDMDDDAFLTDGDYGGGDPSLSGRLFQPKPRPHVQRRATIPGAIARHTLPFDRLLQSYCHHRQLLCSPVGDSFSPDSCCSLFRNKDHPDSRVVTRPHTCIGTEKKQQQQERESLKGSHRQAWKTTKQRDEEEEDKDDEEDDDSSMPFIDESDEKDEDEVEEEEAEETKKKIKESSGGVSYRKQDSSSSIASAVESCSSPAGVLPPPSTAGQNIPPPIRITTPRKAYGKDRFNFSLLSSPDPSSPDAQSRAPPVPSIGSPHPPSPPKSPVDPNDVKATRRILDDRPRLDKSYSSPTYDLEDREAVTFLDSATLDVPKPKAASVDTRSEADSSETSSLNTVEDHSVSSSETHQTNSVTAVSSEASLKVFLPPRHHGNDTTASSVGSSSAARPSIQMASTSDSSRLTENGSYSLGFKGNICVPRRNADGPSASTLDMDPLCSDIPSSVAPPAPDSPSPYVNMNAPMSVNAPRSAFDGSHHTNPFPDYLPPPRPSKHLNNIGGGSVVDPQFGAVEGRPSPPTGGGFFGISGAGGSSSPHSDGKGSSTDQADSPSNQFSPRVVLREGKSRSPCTWRRGLLLDTSGSRRISCRDLGLGDHHGWLYRRKDSKGFLLSHRWEKRWFILKKSYLYGYRDKDALKADSLIYLPGFQVCPASDVKSKRFAFKIYHSSGATFYFACDTAEERSRWMSQMGVSAIPSSGHMLQPQQEKEASASSEAYYSETDDELEKSPSTQRSSHTSSRVSPGKDGAGAAPSKSGATTTVSPSAHSSKSPKSSVSSPPTSWGSSGSRMASLGSLSSLTGGKGQGLKFLHSSRGSLGQPIRTQNFRSYIRVRETPPTTTPAAAEGTKGGSPKGSEGNLLERRTQEGKGVRRKGSLRERLKQLPASLTLDRRKGQKPTSPVGTTSPLRVVTGSKSETSLLDPASNAWPTRKRSTPDSSTVTSPRGRSPSDSDGKGGRRGSIGGLSASSSSLRSVSPRRGSLDCLVSKGASPSVSPGRGGEGSVSSLASQDEYREGSPEKLWIRSLRSPQPLAPPLEGERLKRAAHYQPPHRGGGGSPLQPAFELSLSASSKKTPPAPSPNRGPQPQRPQVPPRTKFLSPRERLVSPPPPIRGAGSTPPNLTLSPPLEEADSPRTPLKPAMGVSMIGKQRRTPGVLSPREVFFPSPPSSPSLSLSLSTPPSCPSSTLPRSYSGGSRFWAPKIDQILPEYPGMEYPPTFEPESYTLNLSPEGGGSGYTSPPLQGQLKESPAQNTPISSANVPRASPSPPPTLPKPVSTTQGYVNISHVSSTLAELTVKSFHHNIYVTSPCRETPPPRGTRQPPPIPPNKPTRGPPFSPLGPKEKTPPNNSPKIEREVLVGGPLPISSPSQPPSEISSSPQDSTNNYLPMGVVCPPRFQGAAPTTRVRLMKPRGGDESRC